ncbi:hypothetical protein PHYBOEH_002562 [Phytophthora boehmeriae]|uniref:BZIP domain-containing protein n=1 Tax=Phytophthora boehmeriae TaxID=109152 RepID=A0A8T1WU92_9STRA|nr:hypothetical protein PHYBOEH_002562 [Phytophthora boehmeriae]
MAQEEPYLDDFVDFLETSGLLVEARASQSTPRGSDVLPTTLRFDSDATSQTSSGSEEPKKRKRSTGTRQEKEKNRQRRYRQRLRDDRQELLQQVDELSAELLELSQNKNRVKPAATRTDQLIPSSWVLVATRQRDHRRQSEAENKRLHAAINTQAAYIKDLSAVFGTHPGVLGQALSCSPKVPRPRSMANSLHTTHLNILEGYYARLDSVMDASGVHSLPETTRHSVHRRSNDGKVAYFQHLTKMLLPFEFQHTCDGLWRVLNLTHGENLDATAPVPANDVVDKTRLQKPLEGGELFQHNVSRKYVESSRWVVVWTMSYEGDGAFSGLRSDETGWVSVQPSATGTLIETCVQQVPMRCDQNQDCEPAVDLFHDVLHSSLDGDKEMVMSALEKLLLDDAVTQIKC